MTELKLTKLEVAKRQLDTAIDLFFSNGDDVSIHALASAANDILKDIGKYYKKTTIHNNLMNTIKEDKVKEVIDILNKPKNFFKHADQKPEEELVFYPASNETLILIAVQAFSELNGKTTPTMISYRIFFYLKNPELFNFKEHGQHWIDLSKKIDLNDKKSFKMLIKELEKIDLLQD